MNQRTKLLVGILMLMLLLLLAGLIRVALETTKSAGSSPHADNSAAHTAVTSEIFQDPETGLYGVRDTLEHVLVEPRWRQLSFASDTTLIAADRIGGTLLYGMLDLEETILVPFACRTIASFSPSLLQATLQADDTVIFYRTDGSPVFENAWDSCTRKGDVLELQRGRDLYVARITENVPTRDLYVEQIMGNGLTMTELHLKTAVAGCPVAFDIPRSSIAEARSYTVFPQISELMTQYLTAVVTNDYAPVYSLANAESYNAVIREGLFTSKTLNRIAVQSVTADETDTIYRYTCRVTLYYTAETPEPEVAPREAAMNLTVTMQCGTDGTLQLSGCTDQVGIADAQS